MSAEIRARFEAILGELGLAYETDAQGDWVLESSSGKIWAHVAGDQLELYRLIYELTDEPEKLGDFFYVFLYLNGTEAASGAFFAVYRRGDDEYIAITSTLAAATADRVEVEQVVRSFDDLMGMFERASD